MKEGSSGLRRPGVIRAVAVDVDGTLTGSDRRVSLEAVAALRKVEDSGVPVMLASGNVLPIAYALAQYLGFKGPVIAENGGLVCYQQRVWTLGDSSKPTEALRYLESKMNIERLFTDRWRVTEVGLKRETDLDTVRELLSTHDVDVQTTGYAVHIMEKGMDKILGVKLGCELLGISPKEVAAIGDSENDAMMLSECGWGIAIGNAMEQSKRVADHVTTRDNGAGVVEALAWLGLI